MIVAKFGGTSVKDATALNALSSIVKNNNNIRVVVVSAVSGITQLLLDTSHTSAAERNNVVERIAQIHWDILNNLGYDRNQDNPLFDLLEKTLAGLRSASKTESMTPRDRDDWLSYGELLSSILATLALKKHKVAARFFDIREILKTDNEFGRANPLVDKIKLLASEKLQPLLKDNVVVLQGFIGQTLSGDTTTLGRGGSDYSGAIIGEATHADFVYIYTDTDGVYTADPRKVKGAHHIPKLTFDEMGELANFGFKVLHPSTLIPCSRKNIPILIASTFEPDKGGTIIMSAEHITREQIKAIAVRKKQVLMVIKSIRMLNTYGFVERIFKIFAEYRISIDIITTSEVSIGLTFDQLSSGSYSYDPSENSELMNQLKSIADVKIEKNLSLITIVGSHLGEEPSSIQRIISAIEEYPIRLINYGANRSNMSFLVNDEHGDAIVEKLHSKFVTN